MKRSTIKLLFGLLLLGLLLLVSVKYYLNSGSKAPDNSVWYEYIGNDTTTGLWPDIYANYFAYTFIKTSDDLCLKIKGDFPNTRYLSFNVYNLRTKTTQGSIVDKDLVASIPFEIDRKYQGDTYEVNILPKHLKNADLPNKLIIEEDDRVLLVVMRLYDFNEDNYGGQDLPTVEAFEINKELRSEATNLPKGINLRKFVKGTKIAEDIWYMYDAENLFSLDGPSGRSKYPKLPFFRVIGEGMIQNNDNLYLLSAVTKKPREVFIVRFKAPSFVQKTEDIDSADVRYWSLNIGDDLGYVFNAIKDENCSIDEDGYVTIVMASRDSQNVKSKCKELGFNFLEWNVNRQRAYLIYRNMLSHADFEGHLLKVPALKHKGDESFDLFEARQFIGEYAPMGFRMSEDEFLMEF